MPGQTFRQVRDRRTFRFEIAGRGYFAKVHQGVGWREICKNLVTGRRPVIDASNEVRACLHLAAAGIGTMKVVGYGNTGGNPARRRSFVITEELVAQVSLEDLCASWPDSPPMPGFKHRLLTAVATLVRGMHGAGVNHRDLYICHLLLSQTALAQGRIALSVIDLHRAQVRGQIPLRWRQRDLAAMLFSALEIGLTRNDLLRFIRIYSGLPLRQALRQDGPLWRAVVKRARRLQAKAQRRGKDTALNY